MPNSHKGDNGKLLIIGGSELFHAASRWSLDIASKFVDMVFYCSTPSNNELIKEAKGNFWNGIVVERANLENYIEEADAILIGPGMERNSETENLVNNLISKYVSKKWVIDAGALQMVDPLLLQSNHIVTPHHKEMELIRNKLTQKNLTIADFKANILLKGAVDTIIISPELHSQNVQTVFEITGGNAGMTKGGTGDVLAGLVSALYANNNYLTSMLVASYINKQAGEYLYQSVGPFYNASDLVEAIPKVMWEKYR